MKHLQSLAPKLRQALKIAFGTGVAILIAMLLNLQSSMTAGIIAILSIQETKQDTWRVAGERLLAFVSACCIAAVCFWAMGCTRIAFVVYLMFYALLCVCMRWMHALATISVLVTHFVAAGGITPELLLNEALLLIVGASCGMLVNIFLRPNEKAMERLLVQLDEQMVAALRALAATTDPTQPDTAAQDACFDQLKTTVQQAERLAMQNKANRLYGPETGDASYVLLRKSQYRVLRLIRDDLRDVSIPTPQYGEVCAFLRQVADEYHRGNDVAALLHRRVRVLEHMKTQPLPTSRDEFESRAMLYQVLMRMEDFLMFKRAYVMENEKLLSE